MAKSWFRWSAARLDREVAALGHGRCLIACLQRWWSVHLRSWRSPSNEQRDGMLLFFSSLQCVKVIRLLYTGSYAVLRQEHYRGRRSRSGLLERIAAC